jgi:hypothetical protein
MTTYLRVIEENIPDELKALPRWVVWRAQPKKDHPDEDDKVPYNARRPRSHASTTDLSTWAKYAGATLVYRNGSKVDGIGFVLNGDGIVGVDLDDCRDPQTAVLTQSALDLIAKFQSYTEASPSGCGIRIFARGKLKSGRRRSGAVEVYDTERYLTVTGHQIAGTPRALVERQAELDALIESLGDVTNGEAPHVSLPSPTVMGLTQEDEVRLERAKADDTFKALWEGDWSSYGSQSEADLALTSKLAKWFDHDSVAVDRVFRESGLYREKWERQDYRERTVSKAVAKSTVEIHLVGADEVKPVVLPKFPVEVLPEPARVYVEELAATGLPLEYLGPTALCVMAIAVGGGELTVNLGSWDEPLALWYGLVGRTGTGKSPSIKQLRRPLDAVEKGWSDVFEANLGAWKALSDADRKTEAKPQRQRLIVSDYTYESLIRILAVEKNAAGLGVLTDELAGYVKSLGQYKAAGGGYDRQKFLELWSALPQSYDRVEGDIHLRVERPILNIVGGVQPLLLPRLVGEDGLKERFCWSYYDEMPPEDPPDLLSMTTAAQRWDAMIDGLVNQRVAKSILQFTIEAKEVRDAERKRFRQQQISVSTPSHMPGWWAKAPAHFMRHALLLALVDVAPAVGKAHLEKASKLIHYFAAHLEALPFIEQNLVSPDQRSKDEAVEKLVDKLRQAPDHYLTSRQILMGKVAGVRTAGDVAALVAKYEATYPKHTRREDRQGGTTFHAWAPGYAPRD